MNKVLFATDSPKIGSGYAATSRWFCRKFKDLGYDIYATAWNIWNTKEPEMWNGITILPNIYHTSDGKNDNYGNAQWVLDADKTYGFDCIIFHNDFYRHSYISQLTNSIIKKSIFWLPADQPMASVDNWYKNAVIPLMQRGMQCYFISEHGWSSHQHLVPEYIKNRTGFIRHSIELDHYYPLSEEERRIAREKKSCTHNFAVLRIDRNQPRKNFLDTMLVFKEFSLDKPDTFLICKTNPSDITAPRNLNDVVKELDIEKKVIFTDRFYSNEDMRNELFGIANVFLSTSCGEGYGLAIAEAMSCGIPVIATGETAIPEVVGDGGLLIDIEKIEAIDPPFNEVKYCYVDKKDAVKKLNLLYIDWKNGSKLLKQLSENGVKHIRKICDTETIIGQWQNVIENTVKENNKRVIISIVTHNSIDYIEMCLYSIWRNTLYSNYCIVIYDSGSTDGTVEVLNKLMKEDNGRTILNIKFDKENKGFSVGCNYGASFAKDGEYILFLNPDTKVLPSEPRDYVQLLKEKLDDDSRVAVVGPAGDIVIYDSFIDHIHFVGGWCVMVRAKEFNDINGFDENYSPAYFEDIDLCMKFYKAGYTKASAGETDFPMYHANCHAKPSEDVFKAMWTKNRTYFLKKWKSYIKELRPISASVIIAYYNKPEILDLALNGYVKQSKKDFEIIIADDGSTDEVLDVIAKYEDDLIISRVWQEDIGFRKCQILNVAASKARSSCLIFTDGDCVPCEDLVKLHYEVYQVYGNNMITVGLRNDISSDILNNPQDDPSDEKYFVESDWRYRNQKWALEGIEYCAFSWNVVYGCNMSFGKRIWEDIGGFDELFITPGTGEDADFALRAAMNGCHFGYVEKALVYHIAHARQDCSVSEQRMMLRIDEESMKIKYPFHWKAIWLTCIMDLCKILNIDFNEAIRRTSAEYGIKLLAEEWKKANPVTQEQRDEFYKTTNSYIYDLSYYNSHHDVVKTYNDIYEVCKGKRVLDFGAGIGTLTMLLAKCGVNVSYYDLDGKTSEYAQKRFDMHGIKPKVYLDDIDSINDKFDVIIVADVLEHLENPVSYVERLSKLLNDDGCFFMHNVFFTNDDYPMHLQDTVLKANTFDADLMKVGVYKVNDVLYKKLVQITPDSKITIEISTKDRQPYLATLLVSLINQTFKNWELLVTDNSNDESLIQNEQIMKLFDTIGKLGHRWRCNKIPPNGLLESRRIALQNVDTPLTFRVDDDLILEPNFLQILFDNFISDPKLGAIGGLYIFADNPMSTLPVGYENDPNCQGMIDHLDWSLQIHRHPDNKIKNVEHLTSSFLHRTDLARICGCYGLNLSQIAFREDTFCSYSMKLAGWNLKVAPQAISYHFAAKGGGCSIDPEVKRQMAINDDKIFQEWLSSIEYDDKFYFSSEQELFSYIIKKYNLQTYLEIGVEYSKILSDLKVKRKIGVDPKPMVNPYDCIVYQKTSDDFFDQDAPELFREESIDLAFIDGMHLCEFVLRDFVNCEKYSKKDSIIFLHDCFPMYEETQSREIQSYGVAWHGDCWKALYYLMNNRPDLDITLFKSCQGLAMIKNLNSSYEWLSVDFDNVKNQYDYSKDFSFLVKIAIDSNILKLM